MTTSNPFTLSIDASALRALQNAVAPPSDFRYYLYNVHLDLAAGYAVATSGFILAEYPLAILNDTGASGYCAFAAEHPRGVSIALDKKVTAAWGTVVLDFSTGRAQGDKPTQSCGFRVLPESEAGTYPAWKIVSVHQDDGAKFQPNRGPLTGPLCFDPSILQKVTEKALVLVEIPSAYCGTNGYKVTPIGQSYLVTFTPVRPPMS